MKRWVIAAAASLLLLASCSSPVFQPLASSGPDGSSASQLDSPVSELEDIRILLMRLGDETRIVNTAGKLMFAGRNLDLLYDLFTGEPRFIVQRRYEKLSEDENGWVTESEVYSTLYDLEGTLLRDENKVEYNAAFGDYLISWAPNGNGKLFRFSTGEIVLENISYALRMGDYVSVYDEESNPLILVDADGNLMEARAVNCYESSNPDYYVSYSREGDAYGLLDRTLEEVLPQAYERLQVVGDYILTWDGTMSKALRLSDRTEVFSIDGWVLIYYDGEAGIIQSEDYGNCWLIDGKGEILSNDACDYINAGAEFYPAEAFVAERLGAGLLLNQQGAVLAQKPGGYFNELSSGLYALTWSTQDAEGNHVSHSCVLDENGNTVIPEGRYNWLNSCYDRSGPCGLLTGTYRTGRGSYLTDLLDADGRILLSGLNSVDQISGDYLVVKRGFSAGIMDLKGNWLYRTSTFQSLDDE